MKASSPSAWEFLIVCNNTVERASVVNAIQEGGATVNFASDTTAALEQITRRKLDGIFIDTAIDGALSMVGNIRRGGSNRYSVIFACAKEEEEVSRVLNAGVNFVLHKPLDLNELKTVMETAGQMIVNERQRYLRHQLEVNVVLKDTSKAQKAVTANISRGGMALRCSERLAAGSEIHYVLNLPQAEPIHGRGEVAWSNAEGVMGIRFYLMGEEVKDTLWPWIEQAERLKASSISSCPILSKLNAP